jgi:pyruvate ferredoxin oxidoreductase beta subunit
MSDVLQSVKFYQTGTFTVGNRLLAEEERSVQANMQRTNSLNSGHRACQGCGEALGARYAIDAAMRASDNQLIAVNATGCLEVFSTPYPETSWQIPWIHSLFGNAAAVASGVAAAMRVQGKDKVRVIAQGGDGGTTDIGFGCLSGMFERNDDVLYICYDNEAYMNTGVQRSGATPFGASTTTSPFGLESFGKAQRRKDMTAIAVAHHVPYVAQAASTHWHDLSVKVERAVEAEGPAFLNVLTDCPVGWGHEPKLARHVIDAAVETCFWPLYEVVDGRYRLSYLPRHASVEEWLGSQQRFAHLFRPENAELIRKIQEQVDADWNELLVRCDEVPA